MLSNVVINLQQVSKIFEIYSRPSDRLKQFLYGKRRKLYKEFWAVKNLDLKVHRGETVGIVGRNGAGKSTLLQMICGTLRPTYGELQVNGRVAALLELGAGFNPEFTGHENIFMNASILGLSQGEIESRYDSILAFADIGDFVNQPVKSFSSGMYARLAFAVAINVDPDILIVDEALSVGDEAFQRKCFARIEDIRATGGTVLFVSHSAGSIVELCDRAVLMDQGERLLTADPKTVISRYQKLVYATSTQAESIREEIKNLDRAESGDTSSTGDKENQQDEIEAEQDEENSFNEYFDPSLKPQSTVEYFRKAAEISNARILNLKGKPVNILRPDYKYKYEYDVVMTRGAYNVRCGMMLKTISGVELGGLVTHPAGEGIDYIRPGTSFTVSFEFSTCLNPGTYFLNAGIVGWLDGQEEYLHRILDAVMLRIEPIPDWAITGYINFSSGCAGGVIRFLSHSDSSISLQA